MSCFERAVWQWAVFSTFPLEPAMESKADKFMTHIRRRLWLPLGLGAAHCAGASCSAVLDELGIVLRNIICQAREPLLAGEGKKDDDMQWPESGRYFPKS